VVFGKGLLLLQAFLILLLRLNSNKYRQQVMSYSDEIRIPIIGWNMRSCFRLLFTGLLLLCISVNVYASWKLDNNRSNVNFISVKNDTVIEQHYFRNISGSLSEEGKVRLIIDLTSVNTQISIRDERMKKELFETEDFPLTTLTAEIDPVMLSNMTPGKSQSLDVEFMLDLHGVKQPLAAKLQVTGLENGGLLVSTIWPVEIKSNLFGLDKGIAVLKEIAKLNSILLSVPVSAQLVFIK